MVTLDAFRSMLPSDEVTMLARQCAWCREFFSAHDRLAHEMGAATTHGICAGCLKDKFGEEPA